MHKLKQTLKLFGVAALLLAVALVFTHQGDSLVQAQAAVYDPVCEDGTRLSVPVGTDRDGNPLNCIKDGAGDNNPIFVYLRALIQFLAAGVGVVVLLMIVISGVQYITAGGNPETIKSAKRRLMNALIALVLFILLAAILNFLIPGGLFEQGGQMPPPTGGNEIAPN